MVIVALKIRIDSNPESSIPLLQKGEPGFTILTDVGGGEWGASVKESCPYKMHLRHCTFHKISISSDIKKFFNDALQQVKYTI